MAAPRVLAVVVVHDGVTWLGRALEALGSQSYADIAVVAVDNDSRDGSRELLVDRLGPEAVLLPERDLGFGAAIDMALDAQLETPELLLLLHDDLVLAPDAVEHLVEALDADPKLAAVGPKLLTLSDPRRLQAVGFSVDVTGRVDTRLETDEIDHGQRDAPRDVLAVSTAGMLVRHDAYRDVDGLDRRYHVFRDDLDLCWRLWLRGGRVGVHPAAEAHHAAAASSYERLGQARTLGPRYFAERNTLATLLKTLRPARLALVLPLYALLGVARILAFVVTRRFSDAWQTSRAVAWNGLHLRETVRLRRRVQSGRRRTDREMRPLFVRVGPRLRSYAEAFVDFLTGGTETGVAIDLGDEPREPEGVRARLMTLLQRRPLAVGGTFVVLLTLVGSAPMWRPGALRGGEFAPWPGRVADFLVPYAQAWHDVPGVATGVAPSPAPVALGFFTALAGGSGWLAPRLLLLLSIPLAWVLAVRALRAITPHTGGRALGATAYALSPPLLAAIAEGRLGPLVVLVLLPGLVAAAGAVTRPGRSPGASRAAAAVVLVAAVMAAFEPGVLVAAPAATLVLLGTAVVRSRGQRIRPAIVRLGAVVVGLTVLLAPWLPTVVDRYDDLLRQGLPHDLRGTSMLRILLLAPDAPGFIGPVAGVVLVVGALLAVLLAGDRRPLDALALWGVVVGAAVVASHLVGTPSGPWPGQAMGVQALGLAALLALGLSESARRLAGFGFGWRQLGSLGVLVLVVVGVASSGVRGVIRDWPAWTTAELPLPAFLGTEEVAGGSFEVLVLQDVDDTLAWQFTGPRGSTMAARSLLPDPGMAALREQVVEAIVSQTDPAASARLGAINVRYVAVPPGGVSDELEAALGAQLDLEPRAVIEGRLFLVSSWQPEAGVTATADVILDQDRVVPVDGALVQALEPGGRAGEYVGEDVPAGLVSLAASPTPAWLVSADGRVLDSVSDALVARYLLPEDADFVRVRYARQAQWRGLLTLQLVVLLLVLSSLLRPPSFPGAVPGEPRRRGGRP